MASNLHKLLRKSSATRILTALHNPQTLNLSSPLFASQPNLIGTNLLNPFIVSPRTDNSIPSQQSVIFPSFSFGFGFNPIVSTGLIKSEPVEVELNESCMVWADSVKKKRKTKMNKHKYKKLRKRIRRQT